MKILIRLQGRRQGMTHKAHYIGTYEAVGDSLKEAIQNACAIAHAAGYEKARPYRQRARNAAGYEAVIDQIET